MATNENITDKNITGLRNTNVGAFSGVAVLNSNELKSVRSLIAYQAYTKNVGEETIASIFADNFKIVKTEDLPSSRYDDAVKFLVDLNLDEVLN